MTPTYELVVARYAEDVSWLVHVPPCFAVTVYNKGPTPIGSQAEARAARVIPLANEGRESDTYLRHVVANWDRLADVTVFSQGEPFSHSPDFLQLLRDRAHWAPVQPLTCCYLERVGVPPAAVERDNREDYVKGSRVYVEPISLYTFFPTRWDDPGVRPFFQDYLARYGLAQGTHLTRHFFDLVGVDKRAPEVGPSCYAAVFAVSKDRLRSVSREAHQRMVDFHRGFYHAPWILERLWLVLYA